MAKAPKEKTKVIVKTSTRMSKKGPLTPDMLRKLDAYWRAANYLAAGQLYLLDNPLLREPLRPEHLKRTLVGHWGTVPGQNFIYTHLNRVITRHELNMIYVSGPGHGGNAVVAQTYLEGTYSEFYPNVSQDEEGMRRLFRQFSFPGGIGSHCAPETPGSINEGGELGYSLAHAFGAVMDNPTLIAACVVGDGEAETGPLATAWHSNKFLNPVTDGAVLPILHLNGYKISSPTLFSRITSEEVEDFFKGLRLGPPLWRTSPPRCTRRWPRPGLGGAGDSAHSAGGPGVRRDHPPPLAHARVPLSQGLDLPEGGGRRAHRGHLPAPTSFRWRWTPPIGHLEVLDRWLRSYRPEELFDAEGAPVPVLRAVAPGERRMGANPHANGGMLLRDLRTPSFTRYAVEVPAPGEAVAEDMAELGKYVRDVLKLNQKARNFRIFAPDEALSNKLTAAFEASDRRWNALLRSTDEGLSADGRIMDCLLSRAHVPGLAGGYLLTGRHGFSTATRLSSASWTPW